MALRFALASVVLGAVGVVACSSSSSAPSDAGANDESVVSCENDQRVDAYAAGLVKRSASGNVSVTLVSSSPAPPAKGINTWTVRVADGSGAAIVGATLNVVPFMPDHGHGTQVVPVVTANADGSYGVANVYLFMPGVWRVAFTVQGDGGASAPGDEVDFFFCVEG